MGLTINYTIKAGTKEQAVSGLNLLRQKCLDLPFEEVGEVEVKEITQADIDYWRELQRNCDYPNNSRENLKRRDRLMEERGLSTWDMIDLEVCGDGKPTTLIKIELWPGEGCEACNINLRKTKEGYESQGFCKTQYSVHFVRCHTLVCAMLDLAKTVGFEVDVNDEGEYYETRDLKVLAKNLGDYNAIVESVGGALKAAGWDEGQIVCALDQNKTIIKIKD